MKQGFYVHIEGNRINIYEVTYHDEIVDGFVTLISARCILNEFRFYSLYVSSDFIFDNLQDAVNMVYSMLNERLSKVTDEIITVTHNLTKLKISVEHYRKQNPDT